MCAGNGTRSDGDCAYHYARQFESGDPFCFCCKHIGAGLSLIVAGRMVYAQVSVHFLSLYFREFGNENNNKKFNFVFIGDIESGKRAGSFVMVRLKIWL